MEFETRAFHRYSPTIFVACGGAGAKICQRIRRLTLERLGGLGPEVLPGVAYLSIDTDTRSTNANHEGDDFGAWASVLDFQPRERVALHGHNIWNVMHNGAALAAPPHIAEWFDPALLNAAITIDLSHGAERMRPIGRLAAFLHHARIRAAFDAAHREVTSIPADNGRCSVGRGVQVVLCGSLAGGTGSGILQDVAAMILDAHPDVTITGFFLLPEVYAACVGDPTNRKKMMANGHACLSELAYHTLHPFEACYDGQGVVRSRGQLFERIVLLESQNQAGYCVRGPEELYDIAASRLFLRFEAPAFAVACETANLGVAQMPPHSRHVDVLPIRRRGDESSACAFDSYRRCFQSQGFSRLEVPGWRLLPHLSAWLGGAILERLDPSAAEGGALAGVRAAFEVLEREYAHERPRFGVRTVGGKAGDFEALQRHFLGETEAEREAALRTFTSHLCSQLDCDTREALLERALAGEQRLLLELWRACWQALRGEHGVTEAFGAPRQAILERYDIHQQLRSVRDTAGEDALTALLRPFIAQGMPWLRTYKHARSHLSPWFSYVVMSWDHHDGPTTDDALRRVLETMGPEVGVLNTGHGTAADVTLLTEPVALIPAQFASMWGHTGMDEAFRELSARRRHGSTEACLHIDRDGTRFPRLLPRTEDAAVRHLVAWKLLLLALLLGVVRTRDGRARSGLDGMLRPELYAELHGRGGMTVVSLGALPRALEMVEEGADLRAPLSNEIHRSYVNQPPERYERLLALTRYWALYVFPAVDRPYGEDDHPAVSPGRMALQWIERELRLLWQEACRRKAEPEELDGIVAELLARIGDFAEPTGDSAVETAIAAYEPNGSFAEHPPRLRGDKRTDAQRREALHEAALGLLHPAVRKLATAAAPGFVPWLRLSPRYHCYLPSKHGWAPPQEDDRVAAERTDLSVRELVAHFEQEPRDSHAELGARVWERAPERPDRFVRWVALAPLRAAAEAAGLRPYEGPVPERPAPPPPPTDEPIMLFYAGAASPHPTERSLAEIVRILHADPHGTHYVYVAPAWIPAHTDPRIAARLGEDRSPPPSPPPSSGSDDGST